MTTRLWSLTLLVSQLVLGFDHSIDLTRCETETSCFIRESCFNEKSDGSDPKFAKKLVQFNVKTEKLKDGDCDAVIQMKMLNDNKLHVMMHIKNAEKLKKEDGLKLEQGTTKMFHCTPGAVTSLKPGVTVELTGNQIVKDNEFFCAFTALADQIWRTMNKDVNEFPKFSYVKESTPVLFEYQQRRFTMWKEPTNIGDSCDHDFVQSSSKDGGVGIELMEVDTTLSEITCDGGKVKFNVDQDSIMDATSVKCNQADFVWIAEGQTGGAAKDLTGKKFHVYCPKLRCRLCPTAPPLVDCKGCMPPVMSEDTDKEKCLELTCTNSNNKWTTTGKEIIEGKAECRGTTADPTKFAWFLKENELEQAACLEKIDCGVRFRDSPQYPTVLADCPGDTCKIKGLGTNYIKCVTDGDKLKLMPGNYLLDEIECDPQTGRFMETGKKPGSGLNFSSIECIPNPNEPKDNSSYNFIGDYLVRVIKKVNGKSNITEK